MPTKESYKLNRPVYVVDGSRTPFLKARGKPGPFSAADLAVDTGRQLLARQPFAPTDFDEVIVGCVMPSADEANIARIIALRLGCGDTTPAFSVQRNCASGMQALDNAMQDIASGRHDLVLAGGVDAMSHAPLLYGKAMVNWFATLNMAKGFGAKAKVLTKFRPAYLAPVIALLRGLTDPLVGLNMGQTAENLAYRFGITREEMDTFAVESHHRLAEAQDNGYLKEITPIYDYQGNVYAEDDGLRRDSNVKKLATLPPFFDKKFGMVTAANSSQVTDGATLMILSSEEAVKKYKLPVLGRIVDAEWAAVNPSEMGLGPVHASVPLLQRHQLGMSDVDYWELNEAFAAQVLACVRAWDDANYCKEHLGISSAFGKMDMSRLNIDGGGVALGHPVGSSGARIVLHLLHILRRNKAKRGVATICIGGGQGGAMLLENTEV